MDLYTPRNECCCQQRATLLAQVAGSAPSRMPCWTRLLPSEYESLPGTVQEDGIKLMKRGVLRWPGMAQFTILEVMKFGVTKCICSPPPFVGSIHYTTHTSRVIYQKIHGQKKFSSPYLSTCQSNKEPRQNILFAKIRCGGYFLIGSRDIPDASWRHFIHSFASAEGTVPGIWPDWRENRSSRI